MLALVRPRVGTSCLRSSFRPPIGSPIAASVRGLRTQPTADDVVRLEYELISPDKAEGQASTESPILFLHGLFGSKKNNRSISKALARDLNRSVYTIDLRNHGESPHARRHDYVAMASDLEAFMQEHDIQDPTLIGHSMGAKTVMVLALDSPHLVKDIVAVDNAPVDAALGSDFATYIQGMEKVERSDVKAQSQADKILQDYVDSLPVRQFLLGNLYRPTDSPSRKFRNPLGTLAKSLGHLGDFPFKDPGAVRFDKPALFVRGTRSRYVADECLPIIGQFFPRFELVDVEAGHWVISENPEDFKRAVVQFLEPKE